MIKRMIFSIPLLFWSLIAVAQDKIEIDEGDYANQQVEMADAFRADGKPPPSFTSFHSSLPSLSVNFFSIVK